MSALAFLLATIFSICSDLSQERRTFISNNVLYDAVIDLKEYSVINSTHLRGELNQNKDTLSLHNTCASDECTISSKEGTIRPIQNPIDLKALESNRIQSTPFDDLHDAVPDFNHNAPAEAMDSTHLKGELNHAHEILSFHNPCASDECAIPSSEAMNQSETSAQHINPNALLRMTFKRKRKKTNQGMVAMQRKGNGTCHVDQGLADGDGVWIKVSTKKSQVFITTESSPSTTIITPSSIKPDSVRSTAITKEMCALLSSSVTSTYSLCFCCNVKFSAELTYFTGEYVNGTGLTTNARHIDGHYTQKRDTTFITSRSLVHAAEYESRLASIGVVDTMINNLTGRIRTRSSDSRTVSLSPIKVRQKDADAFKIAFESQISYKTPYHCYQGNDVHSSSKAPTHVPPLPQSASNTHENHKKHAESQLNEPITPIHSLFMTLSLFGIIVLSCATIGLFSLSCQSLIGLIFLLVLCVDSIPLTDLDPDGYPTDFQLKGYMCNGHYWFQQEWENDKRKYVNEKRGNNFRRIVWSAAGGKWKCKDNVAGWYGACSDANLFNCNTLNLAIRYEISANQSAGWYRREGTDSNGFNYYGRETTLDRVILYDIDTSRWRVSNAYNGSTIYAICTSVNLFACEWVHTGRTAAPTSQPSSAPTVEPTSQTETPSSAPTVEPTTQTEAPSSSPTSQTAAPSSAPTSQTETPSSAPTSQTEAPSSTPTAELTSQNEAPSSAPTFLLFLAASDAPTSDAPVLIILLIVACVLILFICCIWRIHKKMEIQHVKEPGEDPQGDGEDMEEDMKGYLQEGIQPDKFKIL